MERFTSSSRCASLTTIFRAASTSFPNNHSSRSRLLGSPTSMAFATVDTELLGSTRPDARYRGNVSLMVVGAANWLIGAPSFQAITPATRFPTLPDGTDTRRGEWCSYWSDA